MKGAKVDDDVDDDDSNSPDGDAIIVGGDIVVNSAVSHRLPQNSFGHKQRKLPSSFSNEIHLPPLRQVSGFSSQYFSS